MTIPRSLIFGIGLTLLGAVGGTAVNVFYLIPTIHSLRTSIDNDRASIILAQQQQSNLDKLGRDLDSIKEKQVDLEKNIWHFLNEDAFFQTFETLGKKKEVTYDAPNISDATPNGTLLTRTVTIKIQGPLESCLAAIADIQHVTPLIAIRHLTVTGAATDQTVKITIEAVTLWQ